MKARKYPLVVCRTEQNADIVFVEFPDNLSVDLAAARKIVASRLDFTQNRKHYLIIDISNVRHVSSDAKAYLQRPDGGLKNILAAAFIASNPVAALIANIYIKSPKNFEAKFFSHKGAAFEWIYAFQKKSIDDKI